MTDVRVFADPRVDRDPALDPVLGARLAALAPPPVAASEPLAAPTPLRTRRARPAFRLRVALAAAAVLVIALGAGTASGRELVRSLGRELGLLSVTRSPAPVPAAPADPATPDAPAPALPTYVVGAEVQLPGGRVVRLRHPVAAPYLGDLGTAAALLPGGRALIYAAWLEDEQRSDLRIVDLETGADALFERGAMGVAVRADGAIAYFRAAAAPAGAPMPLDGQLWVRASVAAAPVRWTGARRNWRPVAWSGDALVAVDDHDAGGRQAFVLDAPRRARRVDLFGTPRPDGRRLVGTPDPGGDAPTPPVVVLADPTGARLARLDLRALPELAGTAAVENGPTTLAWLDADTVLAASADELLVLETGGDALRLAAHHRLAAASLVPGATDAYIERVVPLDRSGRYVAVSVSAGSGGDDFRYGVATCDLAAGTCVLGRELHESAVLLPDPAR